MSEHMSASGYGLSSSRAPLGRPEKADFSFLRNSADETVARLEKPQRTLTQTEVDLMQRFEMDIDARYKYKFINELKKDPRFKPSMLEEPKPKFKTVDVGGGPIIKTHKHNKTGLETRKPHRWGPLGGGYWG